MWSDQTTSHHSRRAVDRNGENRLIKFVAGDDRHKDNRHLGDLQNAYSAMNTAMNITSDWEADQYPITLMEIFRDRA